MFNLPDNVNNWIENFVVDLSHRMRFGSVVRRKKAKKKSHEGAKSREIMPRNKTLQVCFSRER